MLRCGDSLCARAALPLWGVRFGVGPGTDDALLLCFATSPHHDCKYMRVALFWKRTSEIHRTTAAELSNDGTEVLWEWIGRVLARTATG